MKNDGTYFLYVKYSNGQLGKVYPDTIYPFVWKDFEFFVHRCVDFTKDDTIKYSKEFWQVSDKECGCSLMLENMTTTIDAKGEAAKKLYKAGVERVKEAINENKGWLK